jgi:hypothetical protein
VTVRRALCSNDKQMFEPPPAVKHLPRSRIPGDEQVLAIPRRLSRRVGGGGHYPRQLVGVGLATLRTSSNAKAPGSLCRRRGAATGRTRAWPTKAARWAVALYIGVKSLPHKGGDVDDRALGAGSLASFVA